MLAWRLAALSGPCTDLITYKHAALAGLFSPSIVSFPLTPFVYLISLLRSTVRHLSCPLGVMQLLHRPVLLPITLSLPTT